jgi:hypothetical protein
MAASCAWANSDATRWAATGRHGLFSTSEIEQTRSVTSMSQRVVQLCGGGYRVTLNQCRITTLNASSNTKPVRQQGGSVRSGF